jgi:hypothetical protein
MTSELNETTPRVTNMTQPTTLPPENETLPSSLPLSRKEGTLHNPYQTGPTKLTYKEALLGHAADQSNRLGIDTFHLMSLLRKSAEKEDNEAPDHISISSDITNDQTNVKPMKTCRMRFQITLGEFSADTYMEELATQVNKVLEVININTPGVKLMPWHATTVNPNELLTELSEDTMDAIKYLYGYKAGLNKPGAQFFRINIAFPAEFTIDQIVQKNKQSIMIPGKQSFMIANSQSINPTTIGWLLRSTNAMADFKDLENVLKALWTVKEGFGLYWATIKDGKPYNVQTATRAIHIETEEAAASILTKKAEKTYGTASKSMEDYPLGMNLMFVQPYNVVKGSAKALVSKLATYQKTNEQMVSYTTWYGEMAVDKSVTREKYYSLRRWLMSVTSITEKTARDGKKYHDKLFIGLHKSPEAQEVRFYYYKVIEAEALNVVAALPLFIQLELNLDPGCFFHKSDYAEIVKGSWDTAKREYKNVNMLNQEQYLNDLEDCFMANRAFVPEVIMTDTTVDATDAEKGLALANGEDEISVLSTLTDKTLKEATTRHSNPSSTGDAMSVGSIVSGMTSKSKTRLAVKEAIKEVSAEHNKAMEEQQQRFQREIATLRKELERSTSRHPAANMEIEQNERKESDTTMDTEIPEQDIPMIDLGTEEEPHIAHSPSPKRPKRAKSRTRKGRGGSKSTSHDINE